MKSNLFKLSFFAAVATTVFAACNQESIESNAGVQVSDDVLSISVTKNDFSPADAESRAVTDETRTTTFEDGDKLGLFVLGSNDNLYYENVPFTYASGSNTWTVNEGTRIYYYKNAKYIVYYPYDAELSIEECSAEAIKTSFASGTDFSTQNTSDAYEAADLMIAELDSPESKNLSFDLKHAFSMIELSVPMRRYITERTYGDGKHFEYTAPIAFAYDIKYNNVDYQPLAVGKGVYRFIVNPGTDIPVSISGNIKYGNTEAPYNFSTEADEALTLAEGKYKRYNITVANIKTDPVNRDIKVGDYYYSDGSIYPYGDQTGNDPMIEGCIGVIFQVEDHTYTQNNETATAELGISGTEWIHGSVIALEDVDGGKITWGAYKTILESNVYNGTNATESGLNLNLLSNMDGYTLSHNESFKTQTAVSTALNWDKPCPPSTSGWYLPSVGQLALYFINIGGYTVDTNTTNLFNTGASEDKKKNAITKIKSSLEIVGADTGNNWWWTINEAFDSNQFKAWTFQITGTEGTNKSGFLTRKKDINTYATVRPVLTF